MKLLSFPFTQLFPITEMIRGDKNDLLSSTVLLFLVAVYAHHQQTLLTCCACWPQCMIAISIIIGGYGHSQKKGDIFRTSEWMNDDTNKCVAHAASTISMSSLFGE